MSPSWRHSGPSSMPSPCFGGASGVSRAEARRVQEPRTIVERESRRGSGRQRSSTRARPSSAIAGAAAMEREATPSAIQAAESVGPVAGPARRRRNDQRGPVLRDPRRYAPERGESPAACPRERATSRTLRSRQYQIDLPPRGRSPRRRRHGCVLELAIPERTDRSRRTGRGWDAGSRPALPSAPVGRQARRESAPSRHRVRPGQVRLPDLGVSAGIDEALGV